MQLPADELCYQALLSRDDRFDGRLFVGVSTTGIYCRPVCRVRTPRPENCRFFVSAEAAERAGFRPCLKCRPEHAPGRAPIDAGGWLANAAAQRIEETLGEGVRPDSLARHLGVSERHLRRVFAGEFGVSPAAYAASRRLQFARRLLLDTALPVLDVAMAAGYGSLRAFNERFRAAYRQAPGELRRAPEPGAEQRPIRLQLAYRPPFDWAALTGFLARRAMPAVEEVEGHGAHARYRRVVCLRDGAGESRGWVEISPAARGDTLAADCDPRLLARLPLLLARLRRLFDLGCEPAEVAAALGALASARPGLRVPGAVDPFEVAVRAILGQQVSVAAARTLAGRLVERFGEPIDTPWPALSRNFPEATALAGLEPATLSALGIMPARASAIVALAREISAGALVLDAHAPPQQTRARLLALPGIGRWTADYIAMRALAWPDAFPEGDVGVHRALGERRRAKVRALAEAWRPWRAYAVMHLWMSLEDDDD